MCWKQYQCAMYYNGWYCSQFYLHKIIWRQIRTSLEKNNGHFTHDGYNYNSGSIAHSEISSQCTWWTRNFSWQQMSKNRVEVYHLITWRTNAIRSKIWKYSLCQTHIQYFRNKMNVKFPIPTIAHMSVFIMYSSHPFFKMQRRQSTLWGQLIDFPIFWMWRIFMDKVLNSHWNHVTKLCGTSWKLI